MPTIPKTKTVTIKIIATVANGRIYNVRRESKGPVPQKSSVISGKAAAIARDLIDATFDY